ncbi:MAG: hypothetical protein H0X30_15460, partial [Anaerolineae bacterium]|nr:hypothetical protein [Anaerolineae bacterium]
MTALADFELRSTPGLFNRLDQSGRKLEFKAANPEAVTVWQDALRTEVQRLLGEFPAGKCDPQPTLIESVNTPDSTCELMVLQTIAGEFMPFYVLTPHNAVKPYKPVIALHGHGTWGAKSLVGLADSPAEEDYIRSYKADYARQVARAGYQVFVPALRGFGVRMEDRELQTLANGGQDNEDIWSCQELGLNALMCGQTLMG